jgi:hypothetical protein
MGIQERIFSRKYKDARDSLELTKNKLQEKERIQAERQKALNALTGDKKRI